MLTLLTYYENKSAVMRRFFLSIAVFAVIFCPAYSKDKAPGNEKVKNVILIIGDGMGLGASAAWMLDQNYAMTAFDRSQYVALVKTYSANSRVTDSAAAATAIATGCKTDNGRLGTLPDGSATANLGELAKKKGLSVGIVVTSFVQDATPGAFYAHAGDRGDMKEIEEALIAFRPDVIVGGGRKYFTDKKYTDVDLLQRAKDAGFNYVETPEAFYATDRTPILGLFSEESYPMVIERDSDFLKDAMDHALDVLDNDSKGFFAMIEGSQIDHAEHANNAEMLMFEMEEFDKAVNAAFDYADSHKGTLVLVTADHETGGVALVSRNRDYTVPNSGMDVKFGSTNHTGIPVILYSYGASSWKFSGVIDNTDIFKRIRSVLIDR